MNEGPKTECENKCAVNVYDQDQQVFHGSLYVKSTGRLPYGRDLGFQNMTRRWPSFGDNTHLHYYRQLLRNQQNATGYPPVSTPSNFLVPNAQRVFRSLRAEDIFDVAGFTYDAGESYK